MQTGQDDIEADARSVTPMRVMLGLALIGNVALVSQSMMAADRGDVRPYSQSLHIPLEDGSLALGHDHLAATVGAAEGSLAMNGPTVSQEAPAPDRIEEWLMFVLEQIGAIHAFAPNATSYRGLTSEFVKEQGIGPATRRGGAGLRHPWGEDLVIQGWDREFALVFTESPAWLCIAALTTPIYDIEGIKAVTVGTYRATAPLSDTEATEVCGPDGAVVSLFVS